jgi:hypothetical protein
MKRVALLPDDTWFVVRDAGDAPIVCDVTEATLCDLVSGHLSAREFGAMVRRGESMWDSPVFSPEAHEGCSHE